MKFSEFSNIRTFEDIKAFFEHNKKVLNFLDQYEGQENFLGSGTSGKVWQVGNTEYCLKVTNDPDEIKISKRLSGGKTDGFLKIFMTVEIENYQLKIQELCHPYPYKSKFPYSPFYPHLYYELYKNEDLEAFYDFLIKKDKDPKQVNNNDAIAMLDLFKRVYEDCERYDVISQYEYLDVHSDNIMQTEKGMPKLVDF